ncbi:YeeE/YedE family protein [Agarivorans albus]|uniref:Probable transmembrane protein n=1 Tax=Agarivorans albus MKT 106 TaxID=1331007 RepID=R9PTC6_AGAAL|nr:YeeE/YedE thiosulfate transporter family protein [Agarivorans albus]GAD02186.1 probable transmembrane protein [Agarivorans albus MKT 106]
MTEFSPGSALVGGMLLGLSVSLLLLLSGRTGGISGILGGIFGASKSEWPWRVAFIAAMAASLLFNPLLGLSEAALPNYSLTWLLAGGFAVGVGTQLANGCTSGHGICGIGRFSLRSIVATMVFMLSAAVVVWLAGGAYV